MSLRPLYGHHSTRRLLAQAARDRRLPASMLFQGPAGVGKQRLALWLSQLLVCERFAAQQATEHSLENSLEHHSEQSLEPCGECLPCRYVLRGQHPDVHWFFPRPSLKDTEIAKAREDMAEATAGRMNDNGLWVASSGTDGIFMVTVRALIQMATLRPAMAKRAVYIVGDAERMVSQASSTAAANAFLKLLEEPPPDTTIILTSSEPGALLPTIKSRVVTVRVLPLRTSDMVAFLDDDLVSKRLKGTPREELLAVGAGAPGLVLSAQGTSAAYANAARILDAVLLARDAAGSGERIKVAAKQGVSGARGAFSDMLDALVVLLHRRARQLTLNGLERQARRTSQGVVTVLQIKERTETNINPQLLAASLVNSLHHLLTT